MVLAFPRAGLRQASGTNSQHWCPNKRQPTEPTGPHVEKGLAAKASDLEFFPLRRHRSIRREMAKTFFSSLAPFKGFSVPHCAHVSIYVLQRW